MAYRAGYIAILGRPNVGKSTLLNHFLGDEIAITTPKAQTTRHMIRGIREEDDAQMIFLDTPGVHSPKNLLGRYMLKAASFALGSADVLLLVIDASWNPRVDKVERQITERAKREGKPIILLMNKVDRARKDKILPLIEAYNDFYPYDAIIPVSAKTGDGLDIVIEEIKKLLPISERLYDKDDWTDQSERLIAQELIREALLMELEHELPYGTAVRIENFQEIEGEDGEMIRSIDALVLCEEVRHRGMILGRGGKKIKEIGTRARQRMEQFFGGPCEVFLTVRAKKSWRDSEKELLQLGYDPDDLKS